MSLVEPIRVCEDAPSHADGPSRKCRIAMYAPGLLGLGHFRRSQLLAYTFARSALQAVILMVADAREASAVAMPPGSDCLTLPGLIMEKPGERKPRYLDMPLPELLALWTQVIRVAVEAFAPDVLITDYQPRGDRRVLDPTLDDLRARGRTRCVLGLRDVLGDPMRVRDWWRRSENEEAIIEYYDAVWIYGDPAVYDLVREMEFSPEVAAKVRYTGYLDQRVRLTFPELEEAGPLAELELPPGRLVLCLVGGGQDGAHLAQAFAEAELPADAHGVIVTGLMMSPEAQESLRARAARQPRLHVLGYVSEPIHLVRRADRVIAMGGYNTICEVLSFEKHALIVPRDEKIREQWIRAERLRELGLIDVLYPDDLSPAALTAWLAHEMGPPPPARDRIDFNGLAKLPQLLAELLALPSGPGPGAPLEGGTLDVPC